MSYTFPASDFDRPETLLAAIGGFWSDTYQGRIPVKALLHARAKLDAQNHLDLLAMVASMSRYEIPVFRRKDWFLLQLRESDRGGGSRGVAAFGDGWRFGDGLAWGLPSGPPSPSWTLPAGLENARLAMNRITGASRTLVQGVDFAIVGGKIVFRADPFDDGLFAVRDIVEDGEVVDREAALWLYAGEFDVENVLTQFGYALGMALESSEGYKAIVNAVFDSLVDGGTQKSVDSVLAAVAGVPLAKAAETVEHVIEDSAALWVVTATQAYRHGKDATATVAVGDTLRPGQSMSDALKFFEFNRGDTSVGIRALTAGPGHLAAGYLAGITFEDKTVPLVVEEDVDGYTRVSFEVGGYPGDVEKFWDDVHAAGIARGATLAMLLDQRPAGSRDTQPTALALPATVNPLGFLARNLWRNNLWVARLRPASFGQGAIGLHNASVLRQVVPAHTSVIVLVELSGRDEPVILDAPGDDARPGYEESVRGFTANAASETLGPAYVAERVKARQMAGRCS